jgi:hypothetical protein
MPPIDVLNLTLQQATDLVAYPADRLAILKVNRAFYTGDHWQQGVAWVGPWPMVPEGATVGQMRAVRVMHTEIERGLVTVNAIKEVVEREATGTIGIEPRWSFGPDGIDPSAEVQPGQGTTPAKSPLQQKAERVMALVTPWWDKVGAHEQLLSLATRLVYGASPRAEASLRLYIPLAMLEDQTVTATDGTQTTQKVLRVGSIEEALDKIHLEVLDADEGRVIVDPDTLADIGIKPTKRQNDEEVVEVTFLEPSANPANNGTQNAKRTVIQTIRAQGKPSVTLDMGGRLPMLTVSRAAFITEQMRQSQKALNFSASVIRRNNETAGFLQDTIVNAHIPGHYEGEGEKRKYVADPIERGPLALNAFRGLEVRNQQGEVTGYTTPAIDHRQPVDPTPAIKSKNEHYADVLGEASQRHVLMSDDATASGRSREQARGEHVKSLRRTESPINRAGRWLIETVVAFAGALANGGGRTDLLDGLRVTFQCYLDPGPLSPEERAQNLSEQQGGALSLTTLIERNGTVDVDAELARMRAERSEALGQELKRAQVYAAWVTAGVGEQEAARRAGLSEAEIQKLTTSQTDRTPATTGVTQ